MPPHFISTNLGPWPWFATKWITTIKNTQLQNENPGSRGINIGLLQNVMPKGFISNFNIQHVTSCFVAGLFVAITSFCRSIGGISFCSHMRAAPTFFSHCQCFPGQTANCYKMVCFLYVIICYPNKSSYKMDSRPHHINPLTSLKNILCYKMVALGAFLKPCFTNKMNYIVSTRPFNL